MADGLNHPRLQRTTAIKQVFKFLNADHAIEDLRHRRLKVSEYTDMNDPFELRGFLVGDDSLQLAMQKVLPSQFGALCFSRTWSNPLLWSHYANKHKGICLGFDLPDSVEAYEPTYVNSIETYRGDLAAVLAGTDPDKYGKLLRKVLLHKYEAWRYEDEIRLMVALDTRDGEHAFRSFDEEQLMPREVIIGARYPAKDVEQVRAAVTGYSDSPRIYRAALRSDRFEMSKTEIA